MNTVVHICTLHVAKGICPIAADVSDRERKLNDPRCERGPEVWKGKARNHTVGRGCSRLGRLTTTDYDRRQPTTSNQRPTTTRCFGSQHLYAVGGVCVRSSSDGCDRYPTTYRRDKHHDATADVDDDRL